MKSIVDKVREQNPYKDDMSRSNMERFAHQAYNKCCDAFAKELSSTETGSEDQDDILYLQRWLSGWSHGDAYKLLTFLQQHFHITRKK